MSDTTYKSKVGYKPPVELDYHEGTPEIKSVWDNMRDSEGKILDQMEEHIVAQCSVAVGVKIDREELIKALRYDRGQYEKGYADGKRDAIDRMEEALQAQFPKRGQYVHGRELSREYIGDCLVSIDYEDWRCSVCGIVFEQWSIPKYKYCPNCGAKMEAQDGV